METCLYCLWTGHDTDQVPSQILKDTKAKDMIDIFIFVSNWQRNKYIEKYNINHNKTLIMLNGIGKPFEKYLDLPLNKSINSMSYCSIPWRGLELLKPIFKKIKEIHNNAILNIYSSLNIYSQEDTGNYDEFKNMDGVNYNPGISQEQLAEKFNFKIIEGLPEIIRLQNNIPINGMIFLLVNVSQFSLKANAIKKVIPSIF